MLTNLALKMVIMITYLSHWDWILYKSRKDLLPYINSYEIHAMCPDGEFTNHLENIYKTTISWEIRREKLLDLQAIRNLRNHIKDSETDYHCFTLKTGILFSIANIFLNTENKAVLSITGLGFMFSKNIKAKIIRMFMKPFIKILFNNSFDIIIFQNPSDQETFIDYSKFSNKTEVIPSSGIKTENFKVKKLNVTSNNITKIILVSRLLYDKGILDYLNLVESFNSDNLEFYLAGERDDGNPRNINEQDMDKLLQSKKLNYLGKIDVEKDLSNFDILVLMSTHEGFSRILLESLYVGLYCIAYKIPGTEGMGNFNNLELIKSGEIEEFRKFINNYDGIVNNSYNTKLVEENYTSKAIAIQFEKIYKEMDLLD
jgi:glycosyltransferase involved in cell wall biosynthesis